MANVQLEATCKLCGVQAKKAGMTRHLEKCSLAHPSDARAAPVGVYHLRAEAGPYWMDLEVQAQSDFYTLDGALRGIWLECCGHLSSFALKSKGLRIDDDLTWDGWRDVRVLEKDTPLEGVLEKGDVLEYDYDFGSTTRLRLKVLSRREAPLSPKVPVRLLARNAPPAQPCEVCGERATQTCTECYLELERGWRPQYFCDKHAKVHAKSAHQGDTYSMLPFWNSPRDGVCGYEGSAADEKRYLHPAPARS